MNIKQFHETGGQYETRFFRHTNAVRSILITAPKGDEICLQVISYRDQWIRTRYFSHLQLALDAAPGPELNAQELEAWSKNPRYGRLRIPSLPDSGASSRSAPFGFHSQ